jgi:hypothetical protein
VVPDFFELNQHVPPRFMVAGLSPPRAQPSHATTRKRKNLRVCKPNDEPRGLKSHILRFLSQPIIPPAANSSMAYKPFVGDEPRPEGGSVAIKGHDSAAATAQGRRRRNWLKSHSQNLTFLQRRKVDPFWNVGILPMLGDPVFPFR